jgi:hypothetical protein
VKFYSEFTQINLADIRGLITNAKLEDKMLEYKQALVINQDKDKKEFLADVSSFANADGGVIIYGLSEKDGVPHEIVGIAEKDLDGLLQKIDGLLQNGIQPRIKHTVKTIALPDNAYIILLRVEKSWNRPHRVILGGHDKFYSRNSAGKYTLDTFELRDMFNFSSTLTERINTFKNERVMSILDGDSPVPVSPGGNVILHFIPFDSSMPAEISIGQMKKQSSNLGILVLGGWNNKYNLNGCLLYSNHDAAFSYNYTQIFRDGTVEAVDGLLFNRNTNIIQMYDFEKSILDLFNNIKNAIMIAWEERKRQWMPKRFFLSGCTG